jgi:hypothetical protein
MSLDLDGWTEHLVFRCEITNKCSTLSKFYYTFQIYPDMFRQVIAIFRGLHMPYKLLQYCLCFGRMWIIVH